MINPAQDPDPCLTSSPAGSVYVIYPPPILRILVSPSPRIRIPNSPPTLGRMEGNNKRGNWIDKGRQKSYREYLGRNMGLYTYCSKGIRKKSYFLVAGPLRGGGLNGCATMKKNWCNLKVLASKSRGGGGLKSTKKKTFFAVSLTHLLTVIID